MSQFAMKFVKEVINGEILEDHEAVVTVAARHVPATSYSTSLSKVHEQRPSGHPQTPAIARRCASSLERNQAQLKWGHYWLVAPPFRSQTSFLQTYIAVKGRSNLSQRVGLPLAS